MNDNYTFNGFIDNVGARGRKYSFFFDGKKLNLNPVEITSGIRCSTRREQCEFLSAMYTCGGTLAFFNNVIYEKSLFTKEVEIYPTYYYRSRNIDVQTNTFDGIRFTGELIHKIFTPFQMVEYDSANLRQNPKLVYEKENGKKTIKLKAFAEVDKSFSAKINNLDVDCSFGVFSPGTITEQDTNLGELKSYFSIKYKTPQPIENLKETYLTICKFFQFLLNRHDIYFDEVAVQHYNEKIKGYEIQGYFIDLVSEQDKPPKACCPYSFFEPHVSKLFEIISQKEINFNYIVKNSKEEHYVTQEQYVNCCGAFEYNYEHYCDLGKSKDEYKYKLIDNIETFLNEKKSSKDEENYVSHIISLLKNDVNSVETCYNRCKKKFLVAIQESINKIANNHCVDAKINFGKLFSDFRNEKAHGELTSFSNEAVAAYLIGIVLIDCILLNHCGYTMDEIKQIIEKRHIR